MKVLITGNRNWNKVEPIRKELEALPKGTIIVHGAARGADSLAGYVAAKLGLKVKEYPAKWHDENGEYRPWAGPERNKEMLDDNPDIDLVIAFHSNILNSKGTANMVRQARDANIKVKLVE